MGNTSAIIRKGRRLSNSAITPQEVSACQFIITEFLAQAKTELTLGERQTLAARYAKVVNEIKGQRKLVPSGLPAETKSSHQSLSPLRYIKILGIYEQASIVLFQLEMRSSHYILFESVGNSYNYEFNLSMESLRQWQSDEHFRKNSKICIEVLKENDIKDNLYWVQRVTLQSFI